MEQRKRIVIIGGGYAGVKALQSLASSNLCEIVLIDMHPYHYLQTEAYELIANECSMSRVTIDLVALCLSYGKHVTFVKDIVREIDFENRCARGQNSCHPYDYLLLCTGSRTAFHTSTIGLREHSHGVKTLPSALSFKHQFEQRLYARMESEGGWCSEPFNIIIGGGGLSGVEIAAEMAHFIRQFHNENTLTCENIHIFLIIPHESVLDGMEQYLIDKATQRLNELGVKIINHSRITSVEEHILIVNGDKSLSFDFMIFAGGIVASTLTERIASEKNKKSQLIVDEYLRIGNHLNVFAAGDIAELRGIDGKLLPPTAQIAEQSGALAASNILALIKEQEINRSQMKVEGMMVALGGKYAAISLFGWIRTSGRLGYWIKTIIMRGYHYRLHRQCAKVMVNRSQTKAQCHTGI